MYIWRNRGRRDRRNNVTDGSKSWVAPANTENIDESDEKVRMKDEEIFIAAYVRQIRQLINKYLTTRDGEVEINHVINEMNKINDSNDVKSGSVSIPPEVRKKDNVYQIFRTFDTDGSGKIDMEELTVLLKHLGIQLEPEELNDLLESLDVEGESDGEIDFDEFYTWFLSEVEAVNVKKKSFNPFKKKNKREGLGKKFKRMTQEIEAKNLIVDKILFETESDLRQEFRIAHPPLHACDIENCHKCFTNDKQLESHKEDVKFHENQTQEMVLLRIKFMAVENAFLGTYGRKLAAHRLLFSTELNGFAYRRNNLIEMPYRPMLADPKGKRRKQLLAGNFVVAADPKMGVRGLPKCLNNYRQHRSTWLEEHQMTSVTDHRALMNFTADEHIDTYVTSEFGAIAEVKLVYSKFIRLTIFIKGEFTNWKPEAIMPNEHGKYCAVRQLGPGKYRYRFVVDGVDVVEETASQLTDDWGHNNVVQVTNPFATPTDAKPIPTEINVRNANLCDDGSWALFGNVRVNSTIQVLDLSNNNVTDDGMMAISEGCKSLLHLRELRLNGNGFTYEGCKYLDPVVRESKTLTTLELSNNRLGDDGAECVGKFLEHHPSVTALFLDSNHINYDGCNNLGASMQYMRNLKELSLSGNIIRTPAAERLSFYLRINGSLTTFNISKNPLGPDGVACMGEMMYENNSITSLDISNAQMMLKEKKTGLLAMCEAIRKNRVVGTLKLKNNGITNDNILDIAFALHQNRVITALDLEFNPIAKQWYEPHTFLKTKLLAKMPTIRTSLDRNIKIQGNPIEFGRYIHRPKQWPEDPDGKWNDKRKWRVDKKKGKKDLNSLITLDSSIEAERCRLEEEFLRAELFKYAVSMASFLRDEEGLRLIKHISKVIQQYIRALASEPDQQPDWVNGSHLAIVTALLTYHNPDLDPPVEGQILVEGENGNEIPIIPPSVHEELIQSVSVNRLRPLFRMLGIYISDEDLDCFQAELLFGGVADSLAIRKLYKKIKNRSCEYIAQSGKFVRVSAITMQMVRPPIEAAKHLLYEQGLRLKRIELRNKYRSTPLQEPRYLCVQCGRRFESERLLRRHDEKKRKDHARLALIEELYVSQCEVIRRAKYLLTGVFFPAYYELNNTMLLPRYYCPQVFDTWGEDGRPVAVIEPDMSYIVSDMMGNWLQVSYGGNLGWTRYRHGPVEIMKPVFKDVKNFWDNLVTYPSPVYYQVSDLLPGHVEIKVRVKPHMKARVIASLEKGMVVQAGAELEGWLQIRYEDFDAMWVLEKSGEIPLMEKLHPLNQNKFANIMHKSPSTFPEEEFELKADDLFNYLSNLKKQEEEERQRIKDEAKRKLLRTSSTMSGSGLSAFKDS